MPQSIMTFDELSEAVYEDLNGRIVTVSADGASYDVIFECDDWQTGSRRRRFALQFDDVRESTATPGSSGNLKMESQHPLLWNHNDEHAEMYFSSAPAAPDDLVGLLYAAHNRLFAGWRALSDCLRASPQLLRAGNGMFAKGPRRIIEEYATAVGDKLRYTIVPGHTPKGGYRVVLFDECYVICRNVTVLEHDWVP
jgi:hypothetical protein